MIDSTSIERLSARELFALALYAETFNINFFRSWANRLRAFDAEAVELLQGLAKDAQQFRDTLYQASQRLFAHKELPELDPELYEAVGRDVKLPEDRYFVTTDREARQILGAALALQKNTIKLFSLIDKALSIEQRTGLLEAMGIASPGEGGTASRQTGASVPLQGPAAG